VSRVSAHSVLDLNAGLGVGWLVQPSGQPVGGAGHSLSFVGGAAGCSMLVVCVVIGCHLSIIVVCCSLLSVAVCYSSLSVVHCPSFGLLIVQCLFVSHGDMVVGLPIGKG